MRVTRAAKEETRKRILDVATELFLSKGYEVATTRDISQAAGIATGTLFNYFPTKESIVLALVGTALAQGRHSLDKDLRGEEELDEVLFAHIAASLRRLKPHRNYLEPALQGALVATEPPARTLRNEHLEVVCQGLTDHGWADAVNEVTKHLYWALFVGIVTFWAKDNSRNQEATLALMDKSMKLFVQSLSIFGGLP